MKKLGKLLLLIIVMLIMPLVIKAKSVINVITEGSESNYKIDANYGWTFNTKNTKATASNYHLLSSAQEVFAKKVFYDSDVDYTVSKVFYVDSESDCSSGKMYILYNNVGMYQGKQVNLKITVKNCKIGTNGQGGTLFKKFKYTDGNYYQSEKASINFYANDMRVILDGLRSVNLQYDFLDKDGNKLNLKGYGTFKDLDFSQAFKMGTGIDKAYIYENYSQVCTAFGNEGNCTTKEARQHLFKDKLTSETDYEQLVSMENTIQSSNLETYSDREYKYAWSTILFSGGSFNLTYYLGEPDFLKSWWDRNGGTYEGFGGGMFNFSPDSLIPFSVEDPVKSVNKKEVKRLEEYVYTTSHRVPYINLDGSDNKYTEYKFNDILEPCLTVKDKSKIVIKNDEGVDVTNKFTVTMTEKDGSLVIDAIAKADYLSTDDFYGHEYEFMITTMVKDNYDLSNYINATKTGYVIPNVANISIKDNGGVTNKVTNKVEVVVSIPKEIVPSPDTKKTISVSLMVFGLVLVAIGTIMLIMYKKKFNNKMEEK